MGLEEGGVLEFFLSCYINIKMAKDLHKFSKLTSKLKACCNE